MRNIYITEKDILDQELQAYAYFLNHEFDFAILDNLSKKFFPHVKEIVKNRGFTGKANSSLTLIASNKDKPVYIILLGLGDLNKNSLNIEDYRRAIGSLVKIAQSNKISSIGFNMPDPLLLDLSYERMAQETSTILHKAAYHFDEFITSPDRKIKFDFDIFISLDNINEKINLENGINKGISIANVINKTRYFCDMPPSRLTPSIFAQKAAEISKENNLKFTLFNEDQIIKMGMEGLAAVSAGSNQECKFAIIEYNYAPDYAPTVALVGKGITFDSGGLSLKPASAMETMKDDMAGAAIVVSFMELIAQFKPKVNVIAFVPMAENMPSGSAVKPGDIVRFYNGKTAEILNTDAEGRLILADALSYAVTNYKLDAIIDLATLTGACAYFLGPYYAGLMGNNQNLIDKIIKASYKSGDRVWQLPMDEDYNKAIISQVADLSNTGSPQYKSGAITAGFFLKNFVSNVPWAHLDIAGVAFNVPDITYLRPGATGFGIRLLTDLIMNWQI